MSLQITEKQRQALAFLMSYIKDRKQMPERAVIEENFGGNGLSILSRALHSVLNPAKKKAKPLSSEKRKDIIDCVDYHLNTFGFFPPQRVIAECIGSEQSAVSNMIKRMRAEGEWPYED